MDDPIAACDYHYLTPLLQPQVYLPQKSSTSNISMDFDLNLSDSDDQSVASGSSDLDLSASIESESQKIEARRVAFHQYVQDEEDTSEEERTSSSKSQKEALRVQDSYIIDKVRDYQQELFERAKKGNVIAV